MKFFWYLPVSVFGLIGILGLLRLIERLFTGEGILVVQVGITALFIFLAWQCLIKARSKKSAQI